jgi:hypothetical protein
MNRRAARADFFDASALGKIYSQEPCSEIARQYFNSRPMKYTTPFCFYEAMNVLKGKWKYKGQLTLDEYLDAAFRLTACTVLRLRPSKTSTSPNRRLLPRRKQLRNEASSISLMRFRFSA